jgi:membrane-associated progesterone receptor component
MSGEPSNTVNLPPPKDDPFTLEELKKFDGSDEGKPIYVSLKGARFTTDRPRSSTDSHGRNGIRRVL